MSKQWMELWRRWLEEFADGMGCDELMDMSLLLGTKCNNGDDGFSGKAGSGDVSRSSGVSMTVGNLGNGILFG